MIRVCSWCKKEMGKKPGEGITHGICEGCYQKIGGINLNDVVNHMGGTYGHGSDQELCVRPGKF